MEQDSNEYKIISTRKIYEVLNVIKSKPEMWLTAKSIVALQNFLNGYMQLGFTDDIYHPGEPDINEFEIFILNKNASFLGRKNVYVKFFLNACNGNEATAFDSFFEYLDEFKNIKSLE